ncbi:50S ribosomal protein L3 N(5)-glutamine methyltransferase [Aliikangiella marina]|uniref:Ribosomal protein uL3 glutamine methyltransferase n=1 Tax=Aliikangiella marina TaxID=1712262 RepID=A0A545TH52_9GAMM|nr:50S ribosomal protein L3 N(5)-glutamine methyltransferase [Aliikangiella marina]TQV76559.1 50S ribosomal protein L3 N(5)-glutamine methyltransferase [Aliikangiella marina]
MSFTLSNESVNNAVDDLKTIQDFIRWSYSCFCQSEIYYGHGTDNPWDEAVNLVLQTFDLPGDTPDAILLSRLTREEKRVIAERVAKRINDKVPVAYLTNRAVFCGSEYYVDERVLVPRSPIGELIENQFQPWIDADSVDNILDLCTGSGCIAIACAQHFPHAMVVAGDISADCIDVANINRQRLAQDNVEFYESDLFENIPQIQYNIIVSNPPYVDQEDFDEIPEEYLAEPKLGLVSGVDGLDLTRQLLEQANDYLAENGILIIEVGNSAMALEAAFPHTEFLWLEFERGGHGVFLLTKEQLKSL